MEVYHLKAIAKRNPDAAAYIGEFLYDEHSIEDMDQYERDLNKDILGKETLEVDENLTYWLGLIYCRRLKYEFNDTAMQVLRNFTAENKIVEQLGPEYSDVADGLFELLNKIQTNLDFPKFFEKRRQITDGNKEWNSGDVFAIPQENGSYVTGRVLLKVKNCLKGKKANPRENGLVLYSDDYLIEIHDGVYENTDFDPDRKVLINGVYVDNEALTNGFWQKIGESEVKIEEIDFPENILTGVVHGVSYTWEKGEILIPIPADEKVSYKYGGNTDVSNVGSYYVDQCALNLMGREDLVKFIRKEFHFYFDLRFGDQSFREHVLSLVDISPSASYHELAQERGIDTSNYLK